LDTFKEISNHDHKNPQASSNIWNQKF
jgi:hypothetical protein